MNAIRWLLPTVSLGLVLGIVWIDFGGERAGPGPLHPAHQAALASAGGSCESCHTPGAGIDPAACDTCHEAIGSQIVIGEGLHGNLEANCDHCHGEHHGGEVSLLPPHAFARAGIADLETYDHRHIEFGLTGAHEHLACARCHRHADDFDPPEGGRFLGLSQRCTSCHEDAHEGSYGSQCADCHGQEVEFAKAPGFSHATFPLAGGHLQVACGRCHEASGPHSVQSLGTEPLPARTCADCHENPHGADLIAAANAASKGDCAPCHDAAHATFASAEMPRTLHAATGFPLVAPHAEVDCEKCHTGADHAARFPGRSAEDCRACHDDPHAGQFDSEPRYGQCTECHLRTTFHPDDFGVARHAETAFPLTGAHGAVPCQKCHEVSERGVRVFRGTDHACSTCHDDVHEGAFDQSGLPAEVSGRTGCARCHDTEEFAPVANRFDHALWTGYELSGAHRKASCTDCHPRATNTKAPHRRLGPAIGKDCADCHRDPHAGQFEQDGGTDCRRCHAQDAFPIARFDHDETSFPLDEPHAKLACDACHRSYPTSTGSVVRYRPLGNRCDDCHRLGSRHRRR